MSTQPTRMIRVSEETLRRLEDYRSPGESWQVVVERVLDVAERGRDETPASGINDMFDA